VENIHAEGIDLKLFIDSYLDFTLDLNKFCLFNDMKVIKIPVSMEKEIKYSTSITNNVAYYSKFTSNILDLKNLIKTDTSIKTTITVSLLKICRG
jgi:hypothetical protein